MTGAEWDALRPAVVEATLATLTMCGWTTLLTVLLGLPLGVLLVVLGPGGLRPLPLVHRVLSTVVDLGRSIPFVILLVAAAPVTRAVVGTTIGTRAVVVPLTLGAVPFFARLVEVALREVAPGKVEAARACGASRAQVVRHVLVPEALPALVSGSAVMAVTVVAYSAMAGAVGGGGLGDLAIRYGYYRFRDDVTWVCVGIMVALVGILQLVGDRTARALRR